MIDSRIDEALLALGQREGEVAGAHVDDGVLLAFHRGQLPEARGEETLAHLNACRDCRDLLVALSTAGKELEVPSPARRPWAAMGLALAATAAFAIVAVSRHNADVPAPPPYSISSISGMVAQTRGVADDCRKAGCIVLPHGKILITLRPERDLDGPAPQAAIFLSKAGEKWMPAPHSILERGAGGALAISLPAGEVLGDRFGHYTLLAAISHSKDLLAEVDARSPGDLERDPGVELLSLEFDYQSDAR